MADTKQEMLDYLTEIRTGVATLAEAFGTHKIPDLVLQCCDELGARLNDLEIEEPSTTPGLDEFKDVIWNLYEDCDTITEAQHDFLVEWAEGIPDAEAGRIARDANEAGTVWTDWMAKDSLFADFIEKASYDDLSEFDALEEEDDDEDTSGDE